MKKYLLGLAALAATTFGAFADPVGGDIFEISLTQEYEGVVPSKDNPLTSGEKVTIKVRLLNRDYAAPNAKPWMFIPVGFPVGSIDPEESVIRPRLALLLGGDNKLGEDKYANKVFADYIYRKDVKISRDIGDTQTFTDLYFQYTVQPGDLALPANFSWTNSGADFELTTEGIWELKNTDGEDCIFHYGLEPADIEPTVDPNPAPGTEYSRPQTGVDLGIYIKTVEFDPDPNNEFSPKSTPTATDGIWRLIYKGDATHSALPVAATVNIRGGTVSKPTTVYVWVEDPTVADVFGANMRVIDGVNVLPVTISANSPVQSFQLVGYDSTPGHNTTHVRMSSSLYRSKNEAGDVLPDWDECLIKVADMPDPYVSLQIQNMSGAAQTEFTCSADYEKPIAKLVVSIPVVPDDSLTVKFKLKNSGLTLEGDVCTEEIKDCLIGFSKYENEALAWQGTDLSVTFTAAENVTTKTIYLYGLGPTTGLANGKKLEITSVLDGPSAGQYTGTPVDTAISLKGLKPSIISPEAGSKMGEAMLGKPYTFDLVVSGDYHALANSGWQVQYKSDAMSDTAKWYYVNEGGLDVNEEDQSITCDIDFEQVGEDLPITFRVTDPSGNRSSNVSCKITVVPGRTATPRSSVGDAKVPEGADPANEIKVYFDISATNGKDIFAYLYPENGDFDITNKVSSTALAIEGVKGIPIRKGKTSSTDYATILPLDGDANVAFDLVLCSSESYSNDESKKITTYACDTLRIGVTNVVPKIVTVSMGGEDLHVSGGEMKKAIALNVNKTFKLEVEDPGEKYDLDGTGSDVFRTQWKFGSDGWQEPVVGNPNNQSMTHKFTTPGTYTVSVRCQDKDMRRISENRWTEPFTFTVTVLDMPKIEIKPVLGTKSFYEDQTGSEQSSFEVSLTAPPDIASGSENLRVGLTVEKLGDATADYSSDDCGLSRGYVEFSSGDTGPRTFYLSKLDGSAGSAAYGFRITATVKNATVDKEGKTWADGEVDIVVLNRDPVINSPAERLNEKGEPIVSNAQLGKDYDIKWAVQDVDGDRKKMTVVWETNEGDSKTYQQGAGLDDVMSGTHQFKFNSSGDKTLTITVTDKDGGFASRTFHYTVEASKTIVVAAHGPADLTASANGLSMSYHAAPGLGAGKVTAVGRNPNKVDRWMSSFVVGVSDADIMMTATGYKVGDVNTEIDVYGNYPKTASDSNYEYDNQAKLGADGYDSFVYAWIYNNIAKDGAVIDKDIIFAMANSANAPLPLPTEAGGGDDKKQVAFATQYWEALFSREFYAQDNCGDINLDEIPDVYALRYAPDIFTYRSAELVGDDLKDIADTNIDEDYLPNTDTASIAHFVPGLSNTWVTTGRAFQMRDELRGYGKHFNDATAAVFPDGQENRVPIEGVTSDKNYTNPEVDNTSTLTYTEWVSFTNYCDIAGLGDPANTDNWDKWSPERPTRPDRADTDNDGMPDGYEYYFWYKAHVGWLEVKKEKVNDTEVTVTNLVRITGRRYNQFSPCEPFVITSKEIEELYDPITPNDFAADTDTDNDGLPDLIEFEIGTNPFDYDSDNDGLPDGWEVCMSYGDKVLDPLKAATTLAGYDGNWNPDGDQMATVTIPAYRAKVTYTNDLSKTNYIFVLKGEQYPDDFVRLTRALCIDCPDDDIGLGMFRSDKQNRLTLAEGMLYKAGDPGTYALSKIIANEMDQNDGNYQKAVQAIRLVEEISVADDDQININVLHWHALEIKGFHPWTAWKKPNPPNLHRVNTAIYTTYDEFMLMAWNYQMGTITENEITPNGSTTFMEIWPKYTTQPFNADSDEDGMPDGWELYIMGRGNPNNHPYSPLFPFGNVVGEEWRDPDKDGLDFLEEFNGVECCAEYADCETIKNGYPEWRNKAWPTDPNFADTDGDGLSDGAEHTWLYGSEGVDGGGLNPHSMDTDRDGLPDAWELEFAGTYTQSSTSTEVSESTTGEGTNAVTTVSTNTVTKAGGFEGHGMNPTGSDAREDYDYDGLQNWQEYMIGAMRCWRYDDTTSPWQTHKIGDTMSAALLDDKVFADVVLDPWTTVVSEYDVKERVREAEFNPGFATGYFNVGVYFTCVTKDYDPCRGRWYILKDGIYHDLADETNSYGNYFKRGFKGVKICGEGTDTEKHLNRWTAPYFAAQMEPETFKILSKGLNGNSPVPHKYICCDPKSADSDGDGMDDYYEIFHGLNPLLGEAGSEGKDGGPRDLIYIAYGGSSAGAPHAMANYWMELISGTWIRHHSPKIRSTALLTGDMADMEKSNLVKDATMTGLCFTEFPWLTGIIYADVDGDNIRNEQEAILPNPQAAPTYQHTDPTPLWLTDSSSPDSITYRFYNIVTPGWAITPELPMSAKKQFEYEGKIYRMADFPWMVYNEIQGQVEEVNYNINIADRSDWLYDFEENEGYDSDHDYLSDFEEAQGRNKTASDPQVFDDPIRHQAMYFNGVDAFLQTPQEEPFVLPSPAADTEPRQDFLYFTAEAWVKPDAEMLGKGLYTVLERTLYTGMAGPADERYLRRNFYVGINNGKWYAYFDSTGTDDKKYVAIENGPSVTTNWTHVAVSYGPGNNDEYDPEEPMMLKLFIDGQNVVGKKSSLQPEHGTQSIIITDIGGDNQSRAWNATPTFLVGASVKTVAGLCFDTAWRMRVESSNYTDTVIPEVIFDSPTFKDDYENYFKGYIDEVRLWDGARKPEEIYDDVKNKVRYGFAEVELNRQLVYNAWSQGARRHAQMQTGTPLPAEIRGHWSFDHLPGAVEVKDVTPVPSGFSTARTVTDAMASWARPVGWTNAWWHSVTVRSTVYTDTAWVPWINNTVAHVKNMDGTTFDTMFWTEMLCGVVPASEFGFTKFAFPRTAEVYSRIHQNTYLEGDSLRSPSTRWNLMTNAEDRVKYRYTRRNMNVIGSDLLPMGGAYPKRISTAEGGMWDDGLAADPWAETGADADDNGLPDWWERYARRSLATGVQPWEPLDRNMIVVKDGAKMPLWQAYLYDLSRGMLTDGKLHPEYADNRDADGDLMLDWWEDIYGIQNFSEQDRYADSDKDGLTNYEEYQVSMAEVLLPLNPMMWTSLSLDYPDYFLKSTIEPKYYLGFKYTDHDFIENWLEGQTNGMESVIYDPHLDLLGTGWDNWSRARAQFNERTFAYPEPELPSIGDFFGAETETNDTESVTNEVDEATARVFAGIRPQIKLTAYGVVGEETMMMYDPTTSNYVSYAASMSLKAYQNGALIAEFAVEGETIGDHLVATIDGEGLKQGETIFVLENGEAMGFAKANVGFDLVKLVIEVKESSNVIPSDAYAFAMDGAITYIRRTQINGLPCKPRVVWAGLPANEFGTITEADILNHPNCAFDLDWKYLVTDAKEMGIEQSDIQVATYEVGDNSFGMFLGSEFQKIFVGLDGTIAGFERPKATLVGAMPDGGNVRTARPQFTFKGLELATAFAIEVSTTPSTNGVIYSSINLLPVKTAAGYIFTAPLDIGEELQDGSNYYWRVLGMNAKWSNLPVDEFTVTGDTTGTYKTNWISHADAEWSNWDSFNTTVDSSKGTTGYGALSAKVRYFGDASVTNVVVGVYESADFASEPVTKRHIGAAFESVVKLDGLAEGEYFVMAFNDKNENGKRDAWESWGYLNKVGTEFEKNALQPDYYTPVTVAVTAKKSAIEMATIYMEDTDWGHFNEQNDFVMGADGIPDGLQGEPTVVDPEDIDLDWDGLTKSEEASWGTEPLMSDTDGDGFSDGYEVWAGMDPLNDDYITITKTLSDGTTYESMMPVAFNVNGDNDVMAYAIIQKHVYMVSNVVSGTTWAVTPPKNDPFNGQYLLGMTLPTTVTYPTVGLYRETDEFEEEWEGVEEGVIYALGGEVSVNANFVVVADLGVIDVQLMHMQVMKEFGFISGLATAGDVEKGLRQAAALDGTIGKVGTRPFYGIDKYLVALFFGDPTETFVANGKTVQAMEWSFTSPVKFNKMDFNRRWGKDQTVLSPFTADFDGDAIPDGWELYVAQDPSGSLIISAWKFMQDFKLKDLTTMTLTDGTHPQRLEYNGWVYFAADGRPVRVNDPEWTLADMYNNGINPANPYDQNSLLPGTGVADKDVRKYDLGTPESQLADNDRDGLSNWAEYEGAKLYGIDFDINNAMSVTNRLDYWSFVAATNTYAGAALTDHDFVEDDWEDEYQKVAPDGFYYASRYAADARADRDGDGWSNYAESRVGTDPRYGRKQSLSSVASDGDFTTTEYPIPVIKTTITYNGDVFNCPLVIKAWRGTLAKGDPDAVWNVASLSEEARENVRFLGRNPGRPMAFNLGPGSVAEGSVKLEAFDPYYYTYTDTYETNGTLKASHVNRHGFDTSKWSDYAFFDQPFSTDDYNFVDTGKVDYETGSIVIPFDGEILNNPEYYWNVSGSAGEPGGTHIYETWDLANSYYRIKWRSRVVETGNTKTLYLSVSDEPSEANPCRGYLREGKNLFVVFADLNKDGSWSADEPMGIIRDVDIGWSGTEISVELTDNKTPFERFILPEFTAAEVADSEGTNTTGAAAKGTSTPGRIVITRTAIDGELLEAPRKLIFAGDTAKRLWFGEADYIRRGEFDLDWRYLAADAERLGYTGSRSFHTVDYTVAYLDNPSNIVSEFTRTFDTTPIVPTITLGAAVKVTTARPLLTFKTTDGYTAFSVQIAKDEAFDEVIYEKTEFLPPATSESLGRTFSPEISVGNGLENGETYYWRVAQLNAKFCKSVWSAPASFTTEIDSSENNTGYGAIDATVSYFGSATDSAKNVIVGAWSTPDFTGHPAASARVTNDGTIAGLAKTPATVHLEGLVPGEYYLLAYVEENDNGVRDLNEKWGYVNTFGSTRGGFTPVAITTSSTKGKIACGEIVIENNDLNLSSTSGGVYVSGDADNDGLTDDEEEGEFGTDPYLWDSDGDGMPDGWEVWAGTDPLVWDADYVEDNDLMAYLEKPFNVITVWDGNNLDSRVDYLLPATETVPFVGDEVSSLHFYEPYEYVAGESWGLGTRVTGIAGKVYATQSTTVALVHDQVYAEAGYKWPENTKPFTALDKYLVMRWRMATRGDVDEEVVNKTKAWATYTLKPGYPDNDNDGVMDGWELYVGANPWNFDDRNDDSDLDGLTLVQEYDNGYKPTDPKNVDTDRDGVLDKYAKVYHLKGGDADKDFDGDGLSNYAEYLITEVFKYAKCDPDNARTDGACVDAFKKAGSLYLGEIFTDHDQIDDVWEDQYQKPTPNDASRFYASRNKFDAWDDSDADGWSNYAEFRAGTDPSSSQALSIDGYVHPEYPVPTIEANVTYNGSDVITGPIVFKAWNEKYDYEMVKAPDACWTLGTSIASTAQEGEGQTSATMQGSALQQHEKFLGRKPKGERTFYLTGGNISEGSVKLLFIDKGYGLATYNPLTDEYIAIGVGEPDQAAWYYSVYDQGGKLVLLGGSIYKALGYQEEVVGAIDYVTGRITINFDHPALCGQMAADPADAEKSDSDTSSSGNNEGTAENIYHWVDLDNAYWRVEWKASQAAMSATGVHYFSDPDAVSAEKKSVGHIREGLNSFVCFVDDDGNGEYTPGELFGFLRGVDVGWSGAKFTIELTETHPVFGRVGFDGANDRLVWFGTDSGNITNMTYASLTSSEVDETVGATAVDSDLSGGKLQHVRIDRYAVNGVQIGVGENCLNLPDAQDIMDKWINLGVRPYLHEGDILSGDKFDIDWYSFKDLANSPVVKQSFDAGIQSVSYRIVIDNAEMIHPALSNRVLKVGFTRYFDINRAKPTCRAMSYVYGARPTFRWNMNGFNTYTAFKLRIYDEAGTTLIYESPMTRAPFMDVNGDYVWEAPFFVGDQTPQGKVLAKAGNYQWTVSMFNSKFRDDFYADCVPLITAVNTQQEVDDHGYGSIKVSVKYAGPDMLLNDCGDLTITNGKVRVQAFTSPDFTSIPASQTFVADKATIINTLDNTPNVTICGLPAGEYYIRAYLDLNGNFIKDEFEPWGAAKTAATIAANQNAPVVGLYIEDVDTDGDWLPDAWEFDQYGSLSYRGPWISEGGEIILKSTTYADAKAGDANFSRFLSGASLTFFENFAAAGLLIPDLSSSTATDTIAAIRDAIEKKVKPGTVKINSLVVDAANRKVIMNVGGEVADNIAGVLLTPIYGLTAPTTVTLSIYKKSSLVVNEWSFVKDVEVQIDNKLDQTVEVTISDVDFNSGFYKVEVVQ